MGFLRRGLRRRASQPELPELSATPDSPPEPRVEEEADLSATAAIPYSPELPVEEEADFPAIGSAPNSPETTVKARKGEVTAASPVVVDIQVPRGLGPRVDKKLIQRAVRLAVHRAGWARPATLDVHIVNDAQMREINASRCGVDQPTDVLSFPFLDLAPDKGLIQDFFVLPPEQKPHLGDVVISLDRLDVQAQEGGHSRERELAFLTVHGVLHILGYDHDTMAARRVMRRREEEILGELGLRRNGM